MAQGQGETKNADGPLSFDEVVEAELVTLANRRKALGQDNATKDTIKDNLSALCLSGGGVRSASFCLGFMRALAASNGGLLKRFDYLSTVSGGGFAGSFVTRLVTALCEKTEYGGYARAEEILASQDALQSAGRADRQSPLGYLKENISYLTPRMGLTSLDSLAGVGLYARNLLLNWLIIVPCLLAIVFAVLAVYELACVAAFALNSNVPMGLKTFLPVAGITLAGWSFAESLALRPGWVSQVESSSNVATERTSRLFLTGGFPQSLAALLLAFSVLLSHSQWSKITLWQVVSLGSFIAMFSFLQAVYWQTVKTGFNKGLFVWRLVAVVLQGAVAAAVIFSLGRALVELLPDSRLYQSQLLVAFAPLLWAVGMFAGETLYVALTSWSKNGEAEREWLARNSAAQFRLPIGWLAISLPVAIAPDLISANSIGLPNLGTKEAVTTGVTTLAGLIVVQLGKAKQLWSLAKTGAESFTTWSMRNLLLVALPVFIFGLAVLLSLLAHSIAALLTKSMSSTENSFLSFVEFSRGLWGIELLLGSLFTLGWALHHQWLAPGRKAQQKIGGRRRKFVAALILLAVAIAGSLLQPSMMAFGNTIVGFKPSLYISIAMLFLLAALAADYFIETNKFSIHGIYRNRIIKTFLGAGNVAVAKNNEVFVKIRPSLLGGDGFEIADGANIELCKATVKVDRRKQSRVPLKVQPQVHVFGFSMNIPASKSLAAQERKALPFTASTLHVGSLRLDSSESGNSRIGSYRPSSQYAASASAKMSPDGLQAAFRKWLADFANKRILDRYRVYNMLKKDRKSKQPPDSITDCRALTLGTAAAISGAAVNTNMGYHSSPALSVLLAVFNVRLGVWLGNTNEKGEISHQMDGPYSSLKHLFLEAFGLANERRRFVHLSDGGHFDNLAAYEMIARKCRLIVVVDASADPTPDFSELGVLGRLVYLDLGCRIQFKHSDMDKMLERKSAMMEGEIDYGPNVPAGRIIYVKPTALPEFLTPSSRSYVLANKKFPHEPTVDQWFSESQFTAYFQLGEQIGQQVARKYLAGAFKQT